MEVKSAFLKTLWGFAIVATVALNGCGSEAGNQVGVQSSISAAQKQAIADENGIQLTEEISAAIDVLFPAEGSVAGCTVSSSKEDKEKKDKEDKDRKDKEDKDRKDKEDKEKSDCNNGNDKNVGNAKGCEPAPVVPPVVPPVVVVPPAPVLPVVPTFEVSTALPGFVTVVKGANTKIQIVSTTPATYTFTGMPAGVTSTTTGLITGKPLVAWSSPVSVTTSGKVTNSSLLVFLKLDPTIVNTTLPAFKVGVPVNFQFSTTGYTAPYIFTAACLPAGLKISATGLITGTPTAVRSASAFIITKNSIGDVSIVTMKYVVQ
jgi:hypothetical protein